MLDIFNGFNLRMKCAQININVNVVCSDSFRRLLSWHFYWFRWTKRYELHENMLHESIEMYMVVSVRVCRFVVTMSTISAFSSSRTSVYFSFLLLFFSKQIGLSIFIHATTTIILIVEFQNVRTLHNRFDYFNIKCWMDIKWKWLKLHRWRAFSQYFPSSSSSSVPIQHLNTSSISPQLFAYEFNSLKFRFPLLPLIRKLSSACQLCFVGLFKKKNKQRVMNGARSGY